MEKGSVNLKGLERIKVFHVNQRDFFDIA